MKMSAFSQRLILFVPILSVLASTGIVVQQSLRRDQLQRKMTAFEREHAALEKQYKALRKAAGEPEIPDTPTDGDGHHHEADGV